MAWAWIWAAATSRPSTFRGARPFCTRSALTASTMACSAGDSVDVIGGATVVVTGVVVTGFVVVVAGFVVVVVTGVVVGGVTGAGLVTSWICGFHFAARFTFTVSPANASITTFLTWLA